jgi:hypothetical protein
VDTVRDFEDILELLDRHGVRYLIIGGLAFIFHAKPKYTKGIDIWVDPDTVNVERANRALAEFGSPHLLDAAVPNEILQLGAAPNRIDLLLEPGGTSGLRFDAAWERRIESRYGAAPANWIDLDGLIAIKSGIDHPRHQDDARILRELRARR